jgi:Putative transposase/Transposase zinc-binding domain
MNDRPSLEVADILRSHGDEFVQAHAAHLCGVQRRALADLAVCRTAALGGHVEACSACGEVTIAYNSCRNRHCPKCQAGIRARWLERERGLLLPVDYHHVVFTLPHQFNPLVLGNPAACYGLLFHSAWATLREVASDPRYLGAELGVVAVLHTWGQTLTHHPHLHCLVSGGGLACDADGVLDVPPRWVSCRPGFFLPVRVLSAVFRRHYLAGLQALHAADRLRLGGSLAALAEATAFAAWLQPVAACDWVVHSKPPVHGDADLVLKYLARYVHRVALANSRLLDVSNGQVRFTYKDYARDGQQREMALSVDEFLRRFVQHILPRGFVKVRHYGLLANRGRQEKLTRCRYLLGVVVPLQQEAAAAAAAEAAPAAAAAQRCPHCGGQLVVVEVWPRPRAGEVPDAPTAAVVDTS